MARTDTETRPDQSLRGLLDELPLDRLEDEAKHGLTSLGEWALQSAGDRIGRATEKLDDIAAGGPIGAAALAGAAKDGLPGAVWRAQGGRARLEPKHIRRQVMVHLPREADEAEEAEEPEEREAYDESER